MRYILILILLISANLSFALPCPNGSGILYKGDSVEEVMRQCGQPYEKNTRTVVVNTHQEWSYLKNLAYNAGYAEVIISFMNDRVSAIRVITHYNLYFCTQSLIQAGSLVTTEFSCGDTVSNVSITNLCGWLVSIGDSIMSVQSACGFPQSQRALQAETIDQTELIYNRQSPQAIIFHNGKLVEWR